MLQYEQVKNKLTTYSTRKEGRRIRIIERCSQNEEEVLISFLKKDLYYHIFIMADIYHYGFDKPYQEIFAEKEKGEIKAVFLRYFTNLIIAGEPEEESYQKIWKIVRCHTKTVMGKACLVNRFSKVNEEIGNCPVSKHFYILEDQKKLRFEEKEICVAKEEDVDKIHEFLMTIPEFQTIYGEKEMIENRIEKKEGEHVFLLSEGNIIAHANSAASTPWACMIGGVAVRREYRHQGLGHIIVSAAAKRALENGQVPGVFSEWPEENNLFFDLGFRNIGEWGVLNIC